MSGLKDRTSYIKSIFVYFVYIFVYLILSDMLFYKTTKTTFYYGVFIGMIA